MLIKCKALRNKMSQGAENQPFYAILCQKLHKKNSDSKFNRFFPTFNMKYADKSRTKSSEWKRKRPQVVIFFCIVNINQNWLILKSFQSADESAFYLSCEYLHAIKTVKFNRKSGTDLLDITSLLMYNHVYSWIMSHHG